MKPSTDIKVSIGPEKVNAFMDELDHPFEKEVQVVRNIINSVDKNIAEEIKSKALSFSYMRARRCGQSKK